MQATYRNVGDTLPVYKLSTEDVARSTTLEEADVGKWVFLIQGCLMGFFENEQDCRDRVRQLMTD
jgi:hypothetical protein